MILTYFVFVGFILHFENRNVKAIEKKLYIYIFLSHFSILYIICMITIKMSANMFIIIFLIMFIINIIQDINMQLDFNYLRNSDNGFINILNFF